MDKQTYEQLDRIEYLLNAIAQEMGLFDPQRNEVIAEAKEEIKKASSKKKRTV